MMNKLKINKSKKSGFSLLEVLIAIVVFSFGLLGIAGLMTVSIRSNHNGYLRSQATILGNNMSARMRANVAGLWAGNYNGVASSTVTDICTSGTPCTREVLATYDMEHWGQLLDQLLPSGTGEITCPVVALPVGILSDGLWIASPPFPETCIIDISWNESNETGSSAQTLQLVIQP